MTAIYWLTATILASGILPSFTALSQQHPYLGPLNPLKLGIPIFIYVLWKHRSDFPTKLWAILGLTWGIGSVATFLSGFGCNFPPPFLREWATICVGALAALSFLTLPKKQSLFVVLTWTLVIGSATIVDLARPQWSDWLCAHIFDPSTGLKDVEELNRRVLSGIYGRQALAKFLAWVPWTLILWIASRKQLLTRRGWLGPALAMLLIISTTVILVTSQRGPWLAGMAGMIALGVHQHRRLGKPKFFRIAALSAGVCLALTLLLVPKDILHARLRSIFSTDMATKMEHTSVDSQTLRIRMTLFSTRIAVKNPLGDPCISPWRFMNDAGIWHPGHAHNLFLQQYRDRGWLWGSWVLGLWAFALLGVWRLRTQQGSILFGGLITQTVVALFDYPWFVLNQSMLIWLWLIIALGVGLESTLSASKTPGHSSVFSIYRGKWGLSPEQ